MSWKKIPIEQLVHKINSIDYETLPLNIRDKYKNKISLIEHIRQDHIRQDIWGPFGYMGPKGRCNEDLSYVNEYNKRIEEANKFIIQIDEWLVSLLNNSIS